MSRIRIGTWRLGSALIGIVSVVLMTAVCCMQARQALADRNTQDDSVQTVPAIPSDGIVDDTAPGWLWRGLSSVSADDFHGGTAEAGGLDCYASYTFHGTGVEVFTMTGPTVTVNGATHKLGKLQISVDGKPQSSFDLRQPEVQFNASAAKISGLSDGNHVIELTAVGGWIIVDYLKVTSAGSEATDSPVKSGDPVRLDFSNGFGDTSALRLNGAAAVKYQALVLVDGMLNEVGSAFSTAQVSTKSFHSDFRMQFVQSKADGIVFCLQGVDPTAMGDNGQGIGYAGIRQSLGIKFDVYNNGGEGTDSTGLYLNGANPTVPCIDLSQTPIILLSGHPIDVAIDYDGIALHVKEVDTVTGGQATQNYPIDIPSAIGSHAYVGFTSSTGGSVGTQVVLKWKFGPHLKPGEGATP